MVKDALHPHERGKERLNLPPESVDQIQQVADKMWYSYGRKKLQGTNYYSPLRDPKKNLIGYAAFQRVGQPYRGRLILTTILSREMKPRGDNIGSFFDNAVQGIYPVSPNEPEKFTRFDPVPNKGA